MNMLSRVLRWMKPGHSYSSVDHAHGAPADEQKQHGRVDVPIAAYLLLPAAVLAISSSATVYEFMVEVPPITLASWRLQCTCIVMLPPAVWQWRAMTGEVRQFCLCSGGMLVLSGLCLAVHFGAWVWSLDHTSVAHSLLFVSCSPLILAGWALLMRQRISKAEVYGSLLGLLAAVWLAFSAATPAPLQALPPLPAPPAPSGQRHADVLRSLFDNSQMPDPGHSAAMHLEAHLLSSGDLPFSTPARSLTEDQGSSGHEIVRQPQVAGDISSFVACIAFVGYLQVGSKLRRHMPVFVYALPVTAVAALSLAIIGAITDASAVAELGLSGAVIGWMFHGRYAALVGYLALVPGIVGHTGFNTLLKYMTPLTVALAFQLEAPVGSLIGWVAGVADAPGWNTLFGGSLLLAATVLVTYASTKRQAQENKDIAATGEASIELGHEAQEMSETSALLPPGRPVDSHTDRS